MNFNKPIPMLNQAGAMRSTFPNWVVKYDMRSQRLLCIGEIKPSAWSNAYIVKIDYSFRKSPNLEVLSPKIITVNKFGNKIEHIYSDNVPCTYYPKAKDWTPAKYITIIVPFLSSWLWFYENWHITDEWTGSGIHPTKPKELQVNKIIKESKNENF